MLLDLLELVIVKQPAQEARVDKPHSYERHRGFTPVPELFETRLECSAAVTLLGCPTRSDTPGNAQCCLAVISEPTALRGG